MNEHFLQTNPMARTRTSKTQAPQSTAQQLASLVKSCRDIMRKDKGLNGDLDRLPMLTWIMFLKFLDDMERVREDGSEAARQEGSGPLSSHPTAGAIGPQTPRASPATR